MGTALGTALWVTVAAVCAGWLFGMSPLVLVLLFGLLAGFVVAFWRGA